MEGEHTSDARMGEAKGQLSLDQSGLQQFGRVRAKMLYEPRITADLLLHRLDADRRAGERVVRLPESADRVLADHAEQPIPAFLT
jgi:hypothetical protein